MSKEYKNIDDLFRDKFENFEVDPPESVWENVKSSIGGNFGKVSGGNLNKGGIAGLSLLLITIGLISFFLINNSAVISEVTFRDNAVQPATNNKNLFAENTLEINSKEPHAGFGQSAVHSNEDTQSSGDKKKSHSKKDKKAKVKSSNAKRNSTLVIKPEFSNSIPAHKVARLNLTVKPVKANSVALPGNHETDGTISLKYSGQANAEPGEAMEVHDANNRIDSDIIRGNKTGNSNNTGSPGIRSDYGKIGRWTFGVYFTPEMIVYPSDDQLKNYSYSLDLHASYKFGDYFLQSGVGFARNHDQGNNVIDYNKYLGSYEDVYDVTFDTTASGIIPVYHTETVFVYDSISHVTISPTKRYFTYLQFPMFIGYGEESKRFGWFVKAGPSLSVLIDQNIPEYGMNENQARILNIENELPGRINTNWQFILTAGLTYKLGPSLSFSMEPMFRYYIKSAYEQDKLNTKHPYSIGLRTGFLLNF